MIPKPLAVLIVCAVTLVWLAAFVAQFVVPGYQFDGYLHTVFLIIVGGALGLSRKGGADTPPTADPPPAAQLDGAAPDPTPPPTAPPRAGGTHRAPFSLLPRAAI